MGKKIYIRNLASIIFSVCLLHCKSKDVKREIGATGVSSICTVEFVDSLLHQERICIDKKEKIISYTDTIDYTGEINEILVKNDTITYTEGRKGSKSIALFNNKPLRKYTLLHSIFNIDSMDLVLDLDLLEICYLKNNDNIVIIKAQPMNWVGRMTRFSFFQLINSKEKTVTEFIRAEY